LLNDYGFLIYTVGTFAILLSVGWFSAKFRVMLRNLKPVVKGKVPGKEFEALMFGWPNYASSIIGVLIGLGSSLMAGVFPHTTGLYELPYIGGPSAEMVYSSMPMLIIILLQWGIFAAAAGSIIWMCMSTAIVVRRVTHAYQPRIEFVKQEQEREDLSSVGRISLMATVMPALGMAYTPILLQSTVRFQGTSSLFLAGYALYLTFVLVVGVVPLILFHRWISKEKLSKIKWLQSRIDEVKRAEETALKEKNDLVLSLERDVQMVRESWSWPFNQGFATQLTLVLIGPLAVDLTVKFLLP